MCMHDPQQLGPGSILGDTQFVRPVELILKPKPSHAATNFRSLIKRSGSDAQLELANSEVSDRLYETW